MREPGPGSLCDATVCDNREHDIQMPRLGCSDRDEIALHTFCSLPMFAWTIARESVTSRLTSGPCKYGAIDYGDLRVALRLHAAGGGAHSGPLVSSRPR